MSRWGVGLEWLKVGLEEVEAGRELRMVELKERIEGLEAKLKEKGPG